MAKFRQHKTSLLGGEISPTAFGRTDLAFYQNSCKTLRNMIPLPAGGAYRRPGTFFEKQVGHEGNDYYAPVLLPFIYSQDEAYAIRYTKAIGALDAAPGLFFTYRATSNTALSSEGVFDPAGKYRHATDSNSLGAYDEWHDVQYAQSGDILYLVHPKHMPFNVTRSSSGGFGFLKFDSSLSSTALRDGHPFLDQNTTTIKMYVDAQAATTITSDTPFFDTMHGPSSAGAGDGALIKISDGAGTPTYGCARITTVNSSTSVTVTTIVNFGAAVVGVGNKTAAWWESAWSNYQGWPRTVCFFEDRLCYGGNERNPDSIWFSQAHNYSVFSVADETLPSGGGPTGAEPFTHVLLSQELNLIQWMSPEKTLAVGTTGDEWLVGTGTGDHFGADDISSKVQSHVGSSYNRAVRIGNELIFCTKDEETLRSFVFNFNEDSYTSEPIQTLYDEFPKPDKSVNRPGNRKIRKFAWDKSRDTLWVLDTAGNFFGLTRDRRIPYSAWHSHSFGGADSTLVSAGIGTASSNLASDPNYTAAAGAVMSFEIIPNPIIGVNDIWVVVKRKVSSSAGSGHTLFDYHLERIIGKNIPYDTVYQQVQNGVGQYFADACIWANNKSTYTTDGLTYGTSGANIAHLEGKDVVGTAFNVFGIFDFTGSTVSSSLTTIEAPAPSGIEENAGTASPTYLTSVMIGLPFNSIVEPVRIEAGSQIGTSQGAVKRIHEAHVRFYKTLAAKVGRDADNLETLEFRTVDLSMQESPEFFTGDKRVKLDSDYDRDGLIYLLQDRPLPFGVISIIAEGQEYD